MEEARSKAVEALKAAGDAGESSELPGQGRGWVGREEQEECGAGVVVRWRSRRPASRGRAVSRHGDARRGRKQHGTDGASNDPCC